MTITPVPGFDSVESAGGGVRINEHGWDTVYVDGVEIGKVRAGGTRIDLKITNSPQVVVGYTLGEDGTLQPLEHDLRLSEQDLLPMGYATAFQYLQATFPPPHVITFG